MILSNKEMDALRMLGAQIRPLNAYEIGDRYLEGISALVRRKVGRRKLVHQRIGRQGFTEYQITECGSTVLRQMGAIE